MASDLAKTYFLVGSLIPPPPAALFAWFVLANLSTRIAPTRQATRAAQDQSSWAAYNTAGWVCNAWEKSPSDALTRTKTSGAKLAQAEQFMH